MRAFALLCALCLATSLQAADLEADARSEGGCQATAQPEEIGAVEAGGGSVESTPDARVPAGSKPGVGARSRMSSRWHSLLPGMFR